MIKALIPPRIKLVIKLALNQVKDIRNGQAFLLAKPSKKTLEYAKSMLLQQQLYPNEAKLQNLQIAINAINKIDIRPNEIFSFWKTVGAPTERRGFVASRSLVAGKIKASVGGGLCQLSGMMYYMALMANLEIVERTNHSMDIYTEATRYTPLGSDATVVYGYRDLKIRNNLQHPIHFSFSMDEQSITLALNSDLDIEAQQVVFEQKEIDALHVEVVTLINGQEQGRAVYRRAVC